MLTNIEWWGGFIFIWWAASIYLTFFMVESDESEGPFHTAYRVVSYAFSAIVLVWYFYPVNGDTARLINVACLAIATISTLMYMFWPVNEAQDSSEDEPDSEVKTADDDEEQEPNEYLVLLLVIGPNILACILGAVKVFSLY